MQAVHTYTFYPCEKMQMTSGFWVIRKLLFFASEACNQNGSCHYLYAAYGHQTFLIFFE